MVYRYKYTTCKLGYSDMSPLPEIYCSGRLINNTIVTQVCRLRYANLFRVHCRTFKCKKALQVTMSIYLGFLSLSIGL